MERREALRRTALLSTAIACGCRIDKPDYLHHLSEVQGELFQHFNAGETGDIPPLLAEGFSFVDGAAFGDAERFESRLPRLHAYHAANDNLPLTVSPKTGGGSGDMGWIGCELVSGVEEHRYGFLTQVFLLTGDGWKLIRHHFSPRALI